jgi:hypothetical protein
VAIRVVAFEVGLRHGLISGLFLCCGASLPAIIEKGDFTQ